MTLGWLPYVVAMMRSPELRGYLRDLFALTGGNVAQSRRVVGRMRDQGVVLREAEDAVDRSLDAIDAEDAQVVDLGKKPPRGSA